VGVPTIVGLLGFRSLLIMTIGSDRRKSASCMQMMMMMVVMMMMVMVMMMMMMMMIRLLIASCSNRSAVLPISLCRS
jgi:hypothetical protein